MDAFFGVGVFTDPRVPYVVLALFGGYAVFNVLLLALGLALSARNRRKRAK